MSFFKIKRHIFACAILLNTMVFADSSLSIVDQPSPTVTPGSTQTITWQTNYTLIKVRVELYKNSRFMQILGETTQNTRTFGWKVSSSAKYGSDYLVKVTVTASNGKSDWVNTQTFSIGDNLRWNKNYLWFLLLLVFLVACVCNNRRTRRQSEPLLPYATAVCATNSVYDTRGGGGNTAGGFVAGVAVDELMHHSANRSSWFDGGGGGGGGGGGSWFGGGDFGVSDFGGGGGDSGGGFS